MQEETVTHQKRNVPSLPKELQTPLQRSLSHITLNHPLLSSSHLPTEQPSLALFLSFPTDGSHHLQAILFGKDIGLGWR